MESGNENLEGAGSGLVTVRFGIKRVEETRCAGEVNISSQPHLLHQVSGIYTNR